MNFFPRVLFILKRRPDYNLDPETYSEHGISTGLLNSATFVSDMLEDAGFESKVEVAVDNNEIDRMITEYDPTHVVIEALWVVPEKFDVLSKLHPDVKWIIRLHSELPFIASEGIAMKWLFGYAARPYISFGINAPRMLDEVESILEASGMSEAEIKRRVHFMPNYYPVGPLLLPHEHHQHHHKVVNVGCFGAIRPLKNHLLQAVAALQFANAIDKELYFHINVGRIEMKGEPILNNLIGLFEGLESQGHKLIAHKWMSHDKFVKIIKNIDIGMQATFSETFNIVAADLINNGVPAVVSSEVPWAVHSIADPTDSSALAEELYHIWKDPKTNVIENRLGLMKYSETSRYLWIKYFETH